MYHISPAYVQKYVCVNVYVSQWIIKAELKPSSNNMTDASCLHTQSNAVVTK